MLMFTIYVGQAVVDARWWWNQHE